MFSPVGGLLPHLIVLDFSSVKKTRTAPHPIASSLLHFIVIATSSGRSNYDSSKGGSRGFFLSCQNTGFSHGALLFFFNTLLLLVLLQ